MQFPESPKALTVKGCSFDFIASENPSPVKIYDIISIGKTAGITVFRHISKEEITVSLIFVGNKMKIKEQKSVIIKAVNLLKEVKFCFILLFMKNCTKKCKNCIIFIEHKSELVKNEKINFK